MFGILSVNLVLKSREALTARFIFFGIIYFFEEIILN